MVGDEMGLGKTIQMIAFLAGLRVSKLRSHVTGWVGVREGGRGRKGEGGMEGGRGGEGRGGEGGREREGGR